MEIGLSSDTSVQQGAEVEHNETHTKTNRNKLNHCSLSNNINNSMIIIIIIIITNSVALVCERTIPTERPSLVSEVSANVCG
jgi:hypothetical protein